MQIEQVDPGGAVHVEYSSNDRGRGDHNHCSDLRFQKLSEQAVGCRFAAVVSQERPAVSTWVTAEQVLRAEAHVLMG
jgi:hypothetical protein